MNIGILYPRSDTYPSIGMDFIEALKTCLGSNNEPQRFHFLLESIGFGGTEKDVYEKAEKLLLIEKADILIAYVDERVLQILKPLILSSGKLLIVVNPGANYPENWIPQANILYLTLQHSFLCWLNGIKAAEASSQAAVATSFYDCGYLHVAAFVNAFVKNGGNIIFNYVNKQPPKNFTISELNDFLSLNKQASTLLCIYDALPASLFYSALNQLDEAERLQLFVSPMMLQEKALENLPKGFRFSVHGYIPWMPTLDHLANQRFCGEFEKRQKKKPGIFSLLGWECGLIIEQVLSLAVDDFSDGEAITEQLSRRPFEGPRGLMQLHQPTHFFIAPLVECSINQDKNKLNSTVIEFPWEQWEAFTAHINTGISSGWMNTYLCY